MELFELLQLTSLFAALIYIYQLYIKSHSECERLTTELKLEREASGIRKGHDERKIQENKDDLFHRQQEKDKWEIEKENLHKKLLSLEGQKQNIEIEDKLNKLKNEELSKEIERLHKNIAKLSNTLNTSSVDLEKVKKSIYYDLNTEFEKQFVAKDLQNNSLQRELKNMKNKLQNCDLRHENNIKKHKEFIEEIELLNNLSNDQAETITTLKKDLNQKCKELSLLTDKADDLALKLLENEKTILNLNSQVEANSLEITSDSNKIKELENVLAIKEDEILEKNARINTLEEQLDSSTNSLVAAKEDLRVFEEQVNEIILFEKELKTSTMSMNLADNIFSTSKASASKGGAEEEGYEPRKGTGLPEIKCIRACVKLLLHEVSALKSDLEHQTSHSNKLQSSLKDKQKELELKFMEVEELHKKSLEQQMALNEHSASKDAKNTVSKQATAKIDELTEKLTEKELLSIRLSKQLKELEYVNSNNKKEAQGMRQMIDDKASRIEHLTMQLNNSRKIEYGISEELSTLKKEVVELNRKLASVDSSAQHSYANSSDEKSHQSRISTLESELALSKKEIDKQRAILARNLDILRQYKARLQ